MKKRFLSLFVVLAMVFSACANVFTVSAAENVTSVKLDPTTASPFNGGSFQGWGTSLCWWANRVGYSTRLTQQAADAFFSEDGLGLDIARYNLGGGDDPAHNHITRSDSKVPGVWKTFTLSSDGKDVSSITYDITKDQNQLNMAKAALAANDNLYFEGFSNSAPYFMTVSGCTGGSSPKTSDNLKADMYDDFAKFIADATKLFKGEGIVFQSYSPMNEPDTDYWEAKNAKQEGCHFDSGESESKAIVETRKALDDAGLTNVLVAGMDETNINKSVANLDKLTDEAKTALGRIDTHTYDGSQRAELKAKAVSMNKDLWMSEVDGGWDGFGLAERIILDMNGMQPAAWVMWDIIDRHKDSKFTTPSGAKSEASASLRPTDSLWGVGMADHDTETLYLANKYYFFGQFTKYINPGDTIIASSDSTLAAYNKTSGEIKIVALNKSSSDKKYEFDLSEFDKVGYGVKEIRTNNLTGSAAEHWAEVSDEATLENKKLEATVKAGTVTTYVIGDFITIGGSSERINLGATVNLTANANTDTSDAQWSVSDESVASVTPAGVLTAKKPGDVTVTVTSGSNTATRNFTVYFEITGAGDKIKLGREVQLSVGDSLKDKSVEWVSSDTNVATVTDKGLVTTLTSGEFTITAAYNGNETSKTFTVPSYVLTGTPSWSDSSNAPADKDDYTQVADGDFGTYFDGKTGGWVQYDFGAPYRVSNIKLAARSGNGMAERTVGGKVQGSSDGMTWTDLFEVTTALNAGSYTNVPAAQLKSSRAYRYYRYTNTEKMANIAEFIVEGAPAIEAEAGEPVVTDIDEFTDDFEGSSNIFDADAGTLASSGNTVFASGLARFGNVFAPIKSTAAAELSKAVTLTNKDKFRLTFNMFAGWEDKGKDNTFAIKDDAGEELVAIKLTGGGYNLNQIRVGGENVLSGTPVSQCRTLKKGANGWNEGDQAYTNTVGYNKTVEIIIDGTGRVSVSLTGGLADTSATGTLTAPVKIGSIEAVGNYNSSANRIVTYDNFDGDIITYPTAIEPDPEPEPSDAPELPESGELINLNFNEKTLDSSSPYGKATAVETAKYAEVDGKTCLRLDGTNSTAIKLTDANGNPLLTGQKNITVSFKVKPANVKTSWWLYAAPNDSAQQGGSEKYLGVLGQTAKLTIERYGGGRSDTASSAYMPDSWNDVIVSVNDNITTLYINGCKVSEVESAVNIADMLGSGSAAYIGKANWGDGEYATGYIDDFVIYNYAIPAFDASREAGKISYTTNYKSGLPADMYIALHDGDGILRGVSKNTANGQFTVSDDKSYKITQYIWKGMTPVVATTKTFTDGAYLFVHFVGNESNANMEQIYFSASTDGLNWQILNGGSPVLTSDVGEEGVRDPFVIRGQDGKFFIIATDLSIYNRRGDSNRWSTCQTAGSQNIVVWESADFVNWGEASLVKVSDAIGAGCTWAPEAIYDPERQQYMVFWASKVADDSYAKQRIYRSYTSDFKTFSAPEVYIDNEKSAIDTTILKEGNTYYRFTKNENTSSIHMEKNTSLAKTGWTAVDTYTINGKAGTAVTGYEGPTIYKLNGENKWCVQYDLFSQTLGYFPFVTDDLSKGEFKSPSEFSFPKSVIYRHGSVIPITTEEYNKLITKYGN